jgi:hypothetical protein
MKWIFQTAAVFLWSALLGLGAQPNTNLVQGVVYERTGADVRPLPRAFVSVWSSGGELLGTARTDGAGRYQFVNLPQSRLAVSVSKPGFNTQQAGGRAGSRTILDCSAGCRQSGLDFELSRGAVVAGIVLDRMREPVVRAAVSIRRTGAAESSERPSTGTTDDRGRFRIAGLRAGSYTLTIRKRAPGGQDEVLTKSLNLGEGEQNSNLALILGNEGSFRIAGSVSGIPFGEGYRTWVAIRALSGSPRALQASVGPDGHFQFDSVIAGRYRADASAVKLGAIERTDYFLDVIEVQADTDGIALQPVEPATAAGTLEIDAGTLPAGARIRFTSRDGFGYRWTRVHGAERQFDLSGLRPGAYRVEADSAQFYVKGIKIAGSMQPPDEVILSPGVNHLTVVAAADQSQVFGIVRNLKTAQLVPVPHARVALQGDRGEHLVQADQAGHFLFGKVIPGEYRICAWTSIAPERVEEEVSWEQAGCQSKIITIDPSSEVEIDLRAAP